MRHYGVFMRDRGAVCILGGCRSFGRDSFRVPMYLRSHRSLSSGLGIGEIRLGTCDVS